ncbi:DUF1810 domain-containing protein [Thiomonas sp. FB-Cd]|uniref:DUF1810 domain-containing protein n=1 Tax=Thiomonas sp. FB-Cd TaxID=1158292 RepID=UPI00068A8211|nr:DUF1810 domain-containing protein [Thiomonas sp. FB-Cd]
MDPATQPHPHDPDRFDLDRFLTAQAGAFAQAVGELRSGHKKSHWMWFIFPQFTGLGTSPMSQRYAIRSLTEAKAYLLHPLLGVRLLECTRIVNGLQGLSAHQIFGNPDDAKFHSSMTLFELAGGAGSEFTRALEKYFSAERDPKTLECVRDTGARIDSET